MQDQPKGWDQELARSIGQSLGPSFANKGTAAFKALQAVASSLGMEAAKWLAQQAGAKPGGIGELAAELGGAALGGKAAGWGARATTNTGPSTRITPERQADVDTLRARGIEPSAGQVRDATTLRRAEETLPAAPGGGEAGARMREDTLRQYTDALIENTGETPNRSIPIETHLQNAHNRLSGTGNTLGTIDRALNQLPINVGRDFSDALVQLEQLTQRPGAAPVGMVTRGLNEKQGRRIRDAITNIRNTMEQVGGRPTTVQGPMGPISVNQGGRSRINGQAVQQLVQKGGPIDAIIQSEDPAVSRLGIELKAAIDNAQERTAFARGTRPGMGRRQAWEDLQTAKRQYAALMALQEAHAGGGETAAKNLVTPQRFLSVITNTKDKKLQYALQRSDFQRLTRAANAVLGQLPNSTTAERHWIYRVMEKLAQAAPFAVAAGQASGHLLPGLAAGAGMFGSAVAPGLAGRALVSRPVQNFLKRRTPPTTQAAVLDVQAARRDQPQAGMDPQAYEHLLQRVQEIQSPPGRYGKFAGASMSDMMQAMAIPTAVLRDLLVVKKLTYDQAAKLLGVSRSAVAGKAAREGLASGRQAGEQTAEGMARLRESGKRTGGLSNSVPGGQARGAQLQLNAEQRALRARMERVHRAVMSERPYQQAERPQPSLPKLKFMEGPGPEEQTAEQVLANPSGIPID